MVDLKGKVAIVTGASRGIGRAIAIRLARSGAVIVVNYLQNSPRAEEVARQIEECGSQCLLVRGDVSQTQDVGALIDAAEQAYGTVHILVNNAGTIRDTLVLRMSDEDWDSVMNTNLKATFLCTRAVLRLMVRQRWGRIINITSIVGILGNAGQANYSAAKAGIVGFTKAVAREVGSRNITVNAIAPGFVETDLTNDLPAEVRDRYMRQVLLGRAGRPEDIASAAAFLASEDASYITGHVLVVDGGLGA